MNKKYLEQYKLLYKIKIYQLTNDIVICIIV